MSEIYFMDHKLVQVATTREEALQDFLKAGQKQRNVARPDCQQLDLAWQLCQTPAEDAALRQLVEPRLHELQQDWWSVAPVKVKNSLSAINHKKSIAANYGWLGQVKRSVHFPMDLRQLAADMLEEPVTDER